MRCGARDRSVGGARAREPRGLLSPASGRAPGCPGRPFYRARAMADGVVVASLTFGSVTVEQPGCERGPPRPYYCRRHRGPAADAPGAATPDAVDTPRTRPRAPQARAAAARGGGALMRLQDTVMREEACSQRWSADACFPDNRTRAAEAARAIDAACAEYRIE